MGVLNSTIEHKGVSFHIQTQDKGPQAHYVETLIYKSGKLMTSRKNSYLSSINSPDLKEDIDRILNEQHQTIIKEITEGKFDHFLNFSDP